MRRRANERPRCDRHRPPPEAKAIPANNQYSDMTPKARKAAITRLAKAEKAVNKINKSSQTAQRARAFAEGLTGATKQGYKRYDNDVRRSDIRTPRRRR
jgi:hypothetical protein